MQAAIINEMGLPQDLLTYFDFKLYALQDISKVSTFIFFILIKWLSVFVQLLIRYKKRFLFVLKYFAEILFYC